jgi:hypothetical protein
MIFREAFAPLSEVHLLLLRCQLASQARCVLKKPSVAHATPPSKLARLSPTDTDCGDEQQRRPFDPEHAACTS